MPAPTMRPEGGEIHEIDLIFHASHLSNNPHNFGMVGQIGGAWWVFSPRTDSRHIFTYRPANDEEIPPAYATDAWQYFTLPHMEFRATPSTYAGISRHECEEVEPPTPAERSMSCPEYLWAELPPRGRTNPTPIERYRRTLRSIAQEYPLEPERSNRNMAVTTKEVALMEKLLEALVRHTDPKEVCASDLADYAFDAVRLLHDRIDNATNNTPSEGGLRQ